MLNWEDCVAWCDLNEAEIDAIAKHEHIPEMAARALDRYLRETADGPPAIRRLILEDMATARAQRDHERLLVLLYSVALLGALRHFVATHPKCRAARPGATCRAAQQDGAETHPARAGPKARIRGKARARRLR